ncbi:hypothetical protein PoB_005689000 [Plakobranchus ocellatus]|uniref:Uncharacterized protein n=1 Tax=Plakobranchus ocellatus TaxID=259542 RepID=A0AAV4CCC2_9GAST|nr:hypothetical protein PoB_005689000 [Plakobranchus ocellatus]
MTAVTMAPIEQQRFDSTRTSPAQASNISNNIFSIVMKALIIAFLALAVSTAIVAGIVCVKEEENPVLCANRTRKLILANPDYKIHCCAPGVIRVREEWTNINGHNAMQCTCLTKAELCASHPDLCIN